MINTTNEKRKFHIIFTTELKQNVLDFIFQKKNSISNFEILFSIYPNPLEKIKWSASLKMQSL